MADVTDAAFRFVIAKYGKFTRPDDSVGGGPDVMWTEFVSADGLCSDGKEALLHNLWFDESERPIVAQFFGATPEHFYECALLARELGFDGIDINMGCPEKNVVKQGAGAALIENPTLAKKIIEETKRGADSLPVSVKTRIGFNRKEELSWIPTLLEAEPACIIVHGRTKKEMSLVPADWEAIGRAAELARNFNSSSERTLIIGNGDVADLKDAAEKATRYKVDGVMIGRGIFGNPWLFAGVSPSIEEKLHVMVEHTLLFEKFFKGIKSFDVMKKHYKAYVNGFHGAKELRIQLMGAKDAESVKNIVENFERR